MGSLVDLTGKRFGRLQALSRAENHGKAVRWICLCDCGKLRACRAVNLVMGGSKSCGCLHREKARANGLARTVHGLSKTKEYIAWLNMIRRCTDPTSSRYKNYGAQGVSIFPEWQSDFLRFLRDVGHAPSPSHSLDRIDPHGNYEPGNVRWTTPEVQAANRRRVVMATFRGEERPLAAWCREFGFDYSDTTRRLKRGWSTERAFSVRSKP